MDKTLTDKQILALIQERKAVEDSFRSQLQPKGRQGHLGQDKEVTGDDGHQFAIIVRQSALNHLDFSVILAYDGPELGHRFLLCRYNGRGHEHFNKLESQQLTDDYHIHRATERYQKAGLKEEGFAETTDRYLDWKSALECLIKDCNICFPDDGTNLYSATK